MAWSGASQADLPTRAVADQFFGGLVAVACFFLGIWKDTGLKINF